MVLEFPISGTSTSGTSSSGGELSGIFRVCNRRCGGAEGVEDVEDVEDVEGVEDVDGLPGVSVLSVSPKNAIFLDRRWGKSFKIGKNWHRQSIFC